MKTLAQSSPVLPSEQTTNIFQATRPCGAVTMWLFLVYLVAIPLVTIPVLLALYVVWYNTYWQRRGLPALPAMLYWKCLLHSIFVTKSNGDADVAVYKKLAGKKYAGCLDIMGFNVWVVDPELTRLIYVKDFDHFSDRMILDWGKRMEVMNLMMVALRGQSWKDVRNVVTPTFTSGKMKRLFPTVCENCVELKAYFDKIAEKGEELEVKDAYGRFTMDVIASSGFGVHCNSFKNSEALFPKMATRLMFPPPSSYITLMLSIAFPRFVKLLRALRIPLPDNVVAMQFFVDVVKDTIAEREKTGVKGNDFLQLLLDARKGELEEETEKDNIGTDERKALSKRVLNEATIIAQCIIFIIAGYETTANTLGFAAYELALNPDLQEEVYNEVKEVVDNHKGQVTYDAVMEMELLDKVIHETLRLHTPFFRNLRTCTKDYQIPGTNHVIKKDSLVTFPSFAIHRDERYYPNPTKFDPERFSHEEKAQRNLYTYQAFGQGPRNCVGMRFALMEAKVALATSVLDFRFQPSKRTEIPLTYDIASIICRAKYGVWLKLEKRIM